MTMTEIQTNSKWQEHLVGEMLLFNLVGKVLYEVPAHNWLHPLVEESVFTETPFAEAQPDAIAGLTLLTTWSDAYRQADDPDIILKELQVDYTNLFTGMRKIPVAPWESVYFNEERLVFQEQTLDVRAWYRRYGLEVQNLRREPDDHIGLELIFVAHLAQRALAALEAGNEAAFEQALSAQRDFLSEHLFRWVPIWCQQMVTHAQTDFYRGLALLIRGALHELSHIFDLPLPEVMAS